VFTGDVISLVMHVEGVSFKAAVEHLTGEREPPKTTVQASSAGPSSDSREEDLKRQRTALRVFAEAISIEGTLAELYLLQTRGLIIPEGVSGRALRFHPSCVFGEKRYPCLVALMRGIVSDKAQAIHRTALTPDGQKIGRMMLGPAMGAAVKLTADADVEQGLTIGEGIESTQESRR
jgi:hypothetical protein